MGKGFFSFLFIGFLIFTSCDKSRIYDQYESLPGQWDREDSIVFEFTAPDTIRSYNLFLNVRNNADYNFSNIYLITELHFPNGKVISDTLQYEMAKPSGEWLGTGFGEVKESKLWYKENTRFSEIGDYQVTIKHAMRSRDSVNGIETLEGITELGFRIEDIKQ